MTVGQAFSLLGAKDTETVKLLRRYLFDASVLDRSVGELSGGERNRLQLARAVWLKATFLILDEPTNHLDIESREAVEEALADFEGTILAVSHDRYFLEKVADRIFILDDGAIQAYEGTFSEFWRDVGTGFRGAGQAAQRVGIEDRGKVAGSRASGSNPARAGTASREGATAGSPGRAGGRGSGGGQGSRIGPGAAQLADKERQRRLEELERRIGDLEAQKERLERESTAALTQRDFARAGRLAEEAAKTARQAEKLVEEWSKLG
jgi:ABC-type multidrug transport system ATPase subunit